MPQADIAMIGLGVMGRNLALNLAEQGFTVAVFDRQDKAVMQVLATAGGPEIMSARSLEELIGLLSPPRRVMMMIQAGEPVEMLIEQLRVLLEPGDLIIDGGNSWFGDSTRRCRMLGAQGILFVGAGISGGEAGARQGAAIMAGGHPAAWPLVQKLFDSVAARVQGEVCCGWVGGEGAGHFVKMVHNGIEYAEMQLICEAIDLLDRGQGLKREQLQEVVAGWNQGGLASYLLEITIQILGTREEDGGLLLERILDVASQKGTGRWAAEIALELEVPFTTTSEAVLARFLSSRKQQRVRAARNLPGPDRTQSRASVDPGQVQEALLGGKLVSHAQAFLLLREAARRYGWGIDCGGIARLWRGGCIIRSVLLDPIVQAFVRQPELENLLLDDFFIAASGGIQTGWRQTVAAAVELGVPVPALSSALAYYDGCRSSRLPANLLQAQRDFFGAHGYERIDQPRGKLFHTQWPGAGAESGWRAAVDENVSSGYPKRRSS